MTLQNCLTFVLLQFCKCTLKALACTWTMFNRGFNVEHFATLIMPSRYVFQSMSQMHNPRVILLLLTSNVDEHYLNEDSTQCFSSALCERKKGASQMPSCLIWVFCHQIKRSSCQSSPFYIQMVEQRATECQLMRQRD